MELAKMAASAGSVGYIRKFETRTGGVKVTKACELSLKFVASGCRCGGAFRDLSGGPRFPPTQGAVVARPAYFSEGRTPQQHLSHFEEARILPGYDLRRETKAVMRTAK